MEVEELIASGNLDEVTKIVSDYLKLSPDIESSDRVWCRVNTNYGHGWISYNTMNYKIQ